VLELTRDGLIVTELAPGVELQRDVLDRCDFPLLVSDDLRTMDAALFADSPMGLVLPALPLHERIEQRSRALTAR
jgi:propionate CoA-transferase